MATGALQDAKENRQASRRLAKALGKFIALVMIVGLVLLAERYAASCGVRLADCAFYSDSHSDLPMLAAVGRPVVVDPDPRLRRHARRAGWPIEDWD